MQKIIDLSSYLNDDKTKIVVGDITLTVDNSLNTMLKVDAMQRGENESNIEYMRRMFEVTLGAEGAKKVIDMNLSFGFYKTLLETIVSTFRGDDEGDDEKEDG